MNDPMMRPHYNPMLMGEMTDPAETEGLTAVAGGPKPEDQPNIDVDGLEAALRQVYDPEIPVNIYDLGLIYRMDVQDNGDVAIQMTLTAPACPVAGEMPAMVANAVAAAEGSGEVTVTLTWDPPWDKEMMSEDAKLALGIF